MANRASCCIEQLSTGTWINNDLQPQRKKIRFHFLPFDIAECRQFSTNNWFISWRWRQASNEGACQRACQVENEFLCRSYLYKDSSAGLEYNCQLYHLDHFSLPDGPTTFLTTDRPLLDDGEPVGKFVENVCISKFLFKKSGNEKRLLQRWGKTEMILTVLYGRLSSRTTSAGGRRTLRCFKRDKNGCTLNQREATEELFSVMRQRVGGPRQNSREISQEERRKKKHSRSWLTLPSHPWRKCWR